MKTRRHVIVIAMVLSGLAAVSRAASAEDKKSSLEKNGPEHAAQMAKARELFKRKVGRLLVERCLKCHGGDRVEGDFDLATRERLLRGGANGRAIVVGKPEASYLLRLLAKSATPRMPAEGKPLTTAEVNTIRQWVRWGAAYDKPLKADEAQRAWTQRSIDPSARKFWSFQPLRNTASPKQDGDTWSRNHVDRIVARRLQEHGLQPGDAANRRKLIRRVYLDVIGLPPPANVVEEFVHDNDPGAWQKVVNGLLDSQHYGERWARHWLDVVRFAESAGFEHDEDRPHAYHYRDFVIRALNQDLPYDQFVRWQLAGDEFAPDNPLALMATGFLGAGVFPTQLTEKEFESARYDALDDMVSTTGTAFLGLTVGCARCHDHKFDPIPSADYYRLASAFTTTIRSHLSLRIGKAEKKPVTVLVSTEGVKPIKHHADGRGFPHFYKQTFFLRRGDPAQKDGIADLGYLQVLSRASEKRWVPTPPPTANTSFRRAALAKWITDVELGAGQLLARVIVNRIWLHHFGRGIVATPNDFGAQGKKPSHPELLDYLAAELIANGWRLKTIHRLILNSATYCQSSKSRAAEHEQDPQNVWLWRFVPRRLEAEAIRDRLLAVSGELDLRMYGKGTLEAGMKRRSIYFTVKRSRLIPVLQIFDVPEPLVSVGQRPSTTIASQALLFMNNPHVRSLARAFGATLSKFQVEKAIDVAYRRALSRPPTAEEANAGRDFITRQLASYKQTNTSSARALALADFCQVLMSLNEFIYVD